MISLSHKQIKQIADDLNCGFRCFVHKTTGEIISFPDELQFHGMDDEGFAEEKNKVEENWTDYFEIKPMESRDSFAVMEDFSATVDDEKLRQRLHYALSRPKPFQNFKYEIDYSGEYREKWFAFKAQKMQEWVMKQLK